MLSLPLHQQQTNNKQDEVGSWPIIGSIVQALQPILVPRSMGRQGAEGRAAVGKAITERARSGRFPPLLIFPEGTTTTGRALISFKVRVCFLGGCYCCFCCDILIRMLICLFVCVVCACVERCVSSRCASAADCDSIPVLLTRTRLGTADKGTPRTLFMSLFE